MGTTFIKLNRVPSEDTCILEALKFGYLPRVGKKKTCTSNYSKLPLRISINTYFGCIKGKYNLRFNNVLHLARNFSRKKKGTQIVCSSFYSAPHLVFSVLNELNHFLTWLSGMVWPWGYLYFPFQINPLGFQPWTLCICFSFIASLSSSLRFVQ